MIVPEGAFEMSRKLFTVIEVAFFSPGIVKLIWSFSLKIWAASKRAFFASPMILA